MMLASIGKGHYDAALDAGINHVSPFFLPKWMGHLP
jgi:hypothetical protein